MKVERVKVEVEFCEIATFDAFEFKGEVYLKLPKLTCTVQEYYRHGLLRDAKGDFNAVRINDYDLPEYENFEYETMVRPLKAELKIYE